MAPLGVFGSATVEPLRVVSGAPALETSNWEAVQGHAKIKVAATMRSSLNLGTAKPRLGIDRQRHDSALRFIELLLLLLCGGVEGGGKVALFRVPTF
jgi:hypothetical protein